jgi:GDPmannose 4,6-dehydratase
VKRALLTGITGQDGSYLTELLINKGYEVHGIIRRSSTFTTDRIDHLIANPEIFGSQLFLHYGDMTDGSRLVTLVESLAPSEIYNLAAQSHVRVSFDEPEYTTDSVALGTTRLLEAIKVTQVPTRFYQASSSEMFGSTPPPQDEQTPFQPRSPYAAAKLYSYWMTRNYREAYGLFACNGILFNHESERRGETFVTRKIAIGAAKIALGMTTHLSLGNLEAIRDWGYAPEYVEGMWKMLQTEEPRDYVLATGKGYSVRDFLEFTFGRLGLEWENYIRLDPRLVRATEVNALVGNPTRAQLELNWSAKTYAPELATIMVEAELARLTSQNS